MKKEIITLPPSNVSVLNNAIRAFYQIPSSREEWDYVIALVADNIIMFEALSPSSRTRGAPE